MQVLGSPAIAAATERLAARCWNDDLASWIRRTVPRHIRRGDPSLLAPARTKRAAADALASEGLSPEALDRVERAVRDGDRIHVPHPARLEAFVTAAGDMIDWLTSLPPADRHIKRINRMSIKDALELSRLWHAKFEAMEVAQAELSDGTRTVEEWPGGVRMVQLASPGALKAEGAAMGHCVGGYWPRVDKGECRIFSLRDADGRPHVTIEIGRPPLVKLDDGRELHLAQTPRPGVSRIALSLTDGVVQQVQGKGNRTPVPKWASYADEFLRSRGWSREIQPGGEAIDVYSTHGQHFASAPPAVRHLVETMAKGSRRERSIRRAMPPHAMEIVAACPSDDRTAFDRKFAGMAFKRDYAEPAVRDVLTVGGVTLRARLHRLPLGSMEVVAASLGGELSEMAFERTRAGLSAFLDEIRADPGAVHGYDLPGGCGLTPAIVSDLVLVCGLAARHEEAMAANRAGLDGIARSVREALRIDTMARRKGHPDALPREKANLLANLIEGNPVPRFVALGGAHYAKDGFQSFLPTTAPERRAVSAPPKSPTPPPASRAGLPAVFARFR